MSKNPPEGIEMNWIEGEHRDEPAKWEDETEGVGTTTVVEDGEMRFYAEQQCGPENTQYELWILADADGNDGGDRRVATFNDPRAAEDNRDNRVRGIANADPSDYEIRVETE